MGTFSIAELARKTGYRTAPQLTEAFALAKDKNPSLDLENLDAQSKADLDYWFNRYFANANNQLGNLRKTVTQPTKDLALDLVLLVKAEELKKMGITIDFKFIHDAPKS